MDETEDDLLLSNNIHMIQAARLHQIHRSPYCHVKVACWFDPCVQ